ncbi:hypothetical protein THIOM_004888 [Candidatus Thiomargarita nelsonii]|uniref:Uncharacterized protein n=1 Tax=Candidatus Thiomargarita nelsonii TaxID=1003181 RepID=A0A176RUR7_9GAMM|nr:hypothetical protein THIOM_004888 [Candidatus Thiomargarita nelsonii]
MLSVYKTSCINDFCNQFHFDFANIIQNCSSVLSSLSLLIEQCAKVIHCFFAVLLRSGRKMNILLNILVFYSLLSISCTLGIAFQSCDSLTSVALVP